MMLAVLVVVLIVATTASAYLFYAERDKPKDVEAGEGIAHVAFVREGVVVELDQSEDVDTLTLYDAAGDEISVISVGSEVTRILADLDWVPYMKYRFDVKLASADVLSSPSFAPEKPVPYKLFEISYADEFPVEEYHASVSAHSHTEAVLRFSPDGTRVAVGALEGRVSVIDINQESEIWVKRLDDLSIESVEFTEDGTKVLIGGHHIEYRFHCLDAATGDELWRKDVKSEVGETPTQSAPSTYLQTKGDRVWMGVSASWTAVVDETRSYMTEPRNTSRILHYRSKMYCYNLAGEQIWTFPVDGDADYDDWGGGVMDRAIMQDSIMVDDAGEYLSVAFSSRNGDTSYFDAQLVVFDAREGDILWNWSMPIIQEFSYRSHITNAWLSPDGKWIAVGSMDGRGFLRGHRDLPRGPDPGHHVPVRELEDERDVRRQGLRGVRHARRPRVDLQGGRDPRLHRHRSLRLRRGRRIPDLRQRAPGDLGPHPGQLHHALHLLHTSDPDGVLLHRAGPEPGQLRRLLQDGVACAPGRLPCHPGGRVRGRLVRGHRRITRGQGPHRVQPGLSRHLPCHDIRVGCPNEANGTV
jgi:WD40 repeat protein